MELWLVRHGEALPESADPERPLSPKGARGIEVVATGLAGTAAPLDLVAASAKKRALQTAAILAAAAGYPAERIVATGSLAPEGLPEAFLDFLGGHRDRRRVLCVGHLPSLAHFASFFLTGGDTVNFRFGPGSVCRLHLRELRRGGGDLISFL